MWTGPIDAYFEFEHGRLGYRTLDFDRELHDGDFQGCPVMNYCDPDVPYTRITEHKHFAPWESHERTVTYTEFSRTAEPGDIPYYPIRGSRRRPSCSSTSGWRGPSSGVTFVGRLGTYRYLDMDVTIKEALEAAASSGRAGRPATRSRPSSSTRWPDRPTIRRRRNPRWPTARACA